jgi:adenylate cyclase
MKRKIAAILAADVAEYSRLVAEDEEDALARLMTAQTVFQESIAKHRGRIFNTAGDAILAEFASAVDAARAALDIQQQMALRNQAYLPNRQLHFRIGLSIGDVVEHGTDLLGDGVNIASRLQGFAPLGGLAVSHWVHEQTIGKVASTFRDIGRQTLRNIPAPVHVFVVDLAPRSLPAAVQEKSVDDASRRRMIVGQPLLITLAAALAIILISLAIRFDQSPSSARRGDQTHQNATIVIPPAPKPSTITPANPSSPAETQPLPSAMPPAVLPSVTLQQPAIEPLPVTAPPVSPPLPQVRPNSTQVQTLPIPAIKETSVDRKRVARSCADVLERAQLGDTTPEDQAFLRNQCK